MDADGLGDESQDPDGGGLGMDWEDDWFDDFDEGDELDDDFGRTSARRRGAACGCWTSTGARGDGANLLLRVPRGGRLSAAVTLPDDRSTGAGPFLTLLTGDMNVRRPGRVWLRMDSTTPGRASWSVAGACARRWSPCCRASGAQGPDALGEAVAARSPGACCRRSCGR